MKKNIEEVFTERLQRQEKIEEDQRSTSERVRSCEGTKGLETKGTEIIQNNPTKSATRKSHKRQNKKAPE